MAKKRAKESPVMIHKRVRLSEQLPNCVIHELQKDGELYTLAEAIDKILDGLRLEWFERDGRNVTGHLAESFDGWYLATYHKAYFRRSQQCEWFELREVGGIEENKNYCLADYKSRFRAEIERAVKS